MISPVRFNVQKKKKNMYIATVIFDFINPEGIINSVKVNSKDNNDHIIIDRYEDIVKDEIYSNNDLSGTRIYNIEDCKINISESKIKSFKKEKSKFSFELEHMGIPLSPNYNYTRGYYNLVLPARYKFTKLVIADPYSAGEKIKDKKQFKFNLKHDLKLDTQLVAMELRSSRDTFSFILSAEAELLTDLEIENGKAVKFESKEDVLSENKYHHIGKDQFLPDFVDKLLEIIDIKPNFFGLGVNLNELIKKLRNRN